MPIANVRDTTEVEQKLQEILSSPDIDNRLRTLRELFVGILDYDQADQLVSLESARNLRLPADAHVVARRDGVSVAYIPLDNADTNRVNGFVASAAAKALGNVLADDLLLVFTNQDRDQLHIISPDLSGSRAKLQRLVTYRDQLQRTVPQQIANMWDNYGNKGKTLREAIAEAFNVEPVTRTFFETYRRLFEDARGKINGFKTGEEEQKQLFTQTLFNRLMFVYFLSRKGWLKFEGDTDYLNALWQDYAAQPGPGSFYTARLTPLFFAGLNNPQSMDLMRDNPVLYRAIGDVPFLNGGLFEETDLDKRRDIAVPDEIIGEVLDNLFERFNFTVMESTPYDVEVAVDPEMLGKVFEELVTGRHDSGAYYTPRPVVSFMCREALKGYLEGKEIGLDAYAVARFVDERDTSGISLTAAPDLSKALSEVTVVDPACGSGAYLLGMMQELTELQTILYNIVKDDKKIYDLKLEIIQRNLYGVDIDEFAVNIAMLRMWLSLAIDYEGGKPDPLPNLDFKVLCGDSLLGPDPSAGVEVQGTLGQDLDQFRRLGQLKADYMRASVGTVKDGLRSQIEELTGQIRQAMNVTAMDGVVDWRVEFAEVFAERRGFDIAIANPPYGITTTGRRATTIRHSDSYTNFMALANEIAPTGLMTYITPTSWETGERFKHFRQFLFGKMALQTVVNLPYDVFDNPYVDTAITIGVMGRKPQPEFRMATLDKRTQLDLSTMADYLDSIKWSAVARDGSLRLPLLGWGAELLSRIAATATPLGAITSSKRGIESYKSRILGRRSRCALPFFSGQVRRYDMTHSTTRNFVEVSERDTPFCRGPRILARRIVSRANRLMCAQTAEEFVVKKDIYSIKPAFDDSRKLETLLAIMNSSLISFLYLSRSAAATKDDFRQVTLAGLRELPIIFPGTAETKRELAHLVQTRERHLDQADDLDQQIDQIIYRAYGVTDSEQEAIKDWLAQPG